MKYLFKLLLVDIRAYFAHIIVAIQMTDRCK